MAKEPTPTSYRYQEALAPLASSVRDPLLRKRLSEVLTLLDFNSTLNRSLELSEILDLVLFVSMGETRASWAGILLRNQDHRLAPAARRGASDPRWSSLVFQLPEEAPEVAAITDEELSSWARSLFDATGAHLIAPLSKSDRLVGALLLGDRKERYGAEEKMFAEALAVSAAASIDNGRVYQELRELNRKLSFKVYQLDSVFDITRELNRSPNLARVREVLVTSAMGHVLTTRALILQDGAVVEERGFNLELLERERLSRRSDELSALKEDTMVGELADEHLRDLLTGLGIDIVVPLKAGDVSHGALLLGPRASGKSFAEEDRDFLRSLASQAASALDHSRLTREWVEKQKIEKEMALAREIQRGLLPDGQLVLEGWDIAGINIPCLTVGGDYFDYVERRDGKYWLVIADVSGKGTGAALLMASFQAALHALGGLGDLSLGDLCGRLNEIVYTNTEVNRYVTAFFACLDAASGRLSFVNAGHCYPILMRRDGEIERLVEGAPVIGLLSQIDVQESSTTLEKGDLLVLYTDGLSETRNPEGEEYDDERIIESMRAARGRKSQEIVARLVSGVRLFAAEAGLTDDLTLMVAQNA